MKLPKVNVMNRKIRLCASSLPIVAVGASLICWPGPSQAAEKLVAEQLDSQTTQAQEPAKEPQGHQMRRYQAFARQAEMPPITVTSETTLQVGETTKIEISRLTQLTLQEKETLAGLFGVPAGVIAEVARQVSGQAAVGAAELARELRTAVVDYRFLRQEWGRYHPPAEGRQVKVEAVAALEAGDLAQAWALYDGLSRPGAPVTAPSPPSNLRVVAGR